MGNGKDMHSTLSHKFSREITLQCNENKERMSSEAVKMDQTKKKISKGQYFPQVRPQEILPIHSSVIGWVLMEFM